MGGEGQAVLASPRDGQRRVAPYFARHQNALANRGLEAQRRLEKRWRFWGKTKFDFILLFFILIISYFDI